MQATKDYKSYESTVDEHRYSYLIYGASVGIASTVTRPLMPGDTSTSFFELTITPSTPGSRWINDIPASGPSTKTPFDRPSAMVALVVMIVTLRHPAAGSPVSGSIM